VISVKSPKNSDDRDFSVKVALPVEPRGLILDYLSQRRESMPRNSDAIEQELLAIRCQLGEMAAFDELVARWHAPLWQYVRRITDRNEIADELIQETWLRVLRGIPRLQEPARLAPWMFGITRRVVMDRLRQKYRDEVILESALEDTRSSADEFDESERRAEVATVLEKLDSLPLSQRELLTLYYLEEFSIEEVAQVLEIPIGTVKSRLFHARKMLKQSLINKEIAR
jgi:RNA polymerase sigma-70 factor (ECF subfamily)